MASNLKSISISLRIHGAISFFSLTNIPYDVKKVLSSTLSHFRIW